MPKKLSVGVIGDFQATYETHTATNLAFKHSADLLGVGVEVKWLPTLSLKGNSLEMKRFDAFLCAPGSPYKSTEGALNGIKFARENNRPFLGTCGGCQHAIIEFARNVCGLKGANSSEFDSATPYPVIDLMSEQRNISRLGGSMRLGAYPCHLQEDTFALSAYGTREISERHRHRYEFNSLFRDVMSEKGLVVSGTSPDGALVEMIEMGDHPWFVGCQFHPELKSRPSRAHPLFREFIRAAKAHKIKGRLVADRA